MTRELKVVRPAFGREYPERLTIVPDLGQFPRCSQGVAWSEELVKSLMSWSDYNTTEDWDRMAFAAPTLAREEVFNEPFFDSWSRWANRLRYGTAGVWIRAIPGDNEPFIFGQDDFEGGNSNTVRVYTKEFFEEPQELTPEDREKQCWKTIFKQYTTYAKVRLNLRTGLTLCEWLQKGGITLYPKDEDAATPRQAVVVEMHEGQLVVRGFSLVK